MKIVLRIPWLLALALYIPLGGLVLAGLVLTAMAWIFAQVLRVVAFVVTSVVLWLRTRRRRGQQVFPT